MERRLLCIGAMMADRWWMIGAFTVTLAGASISTWTTRGPRFEGTANAAIRHALPAQREEVAEAVRVPVPPPSEPVRAPPAPAPRRARAPEPDTVSIEVPDLPEPVPRSPLLWDDLFPPPPGRAVGVLAPALAPCFDRLQGIEGLSPCPAVTPR